MVENTPVYKKRTPTIIEGPWGVLGADNQLKMMFGIENRKILSIQYVRHTMYTTCSIYVIHNELIFKQPGSPIYLFIVHGPK